MNMSKITKGALICAALMDSMPTPCRSYFLALLRGVALPLTLLLPLRLSGVALALTGVLAAVLAGVLTLVLAEDDGTDRLTSACAADAAGWAGSFSATG